MKLKKVLAGTLAAAMTFMCVVQSFSAYNDASTEDGIDYEDWSDYVVITGYHGDKENFDIPEEINGKPVEKVTIAYSLYSCKSMMIPSTVNMITYDYFYGKLYYDGMKDYSIEEIHVVEENSRFSSENGILYNKDKTELIAYPPRKDDKAYVMPDTVRDCDGNAFQNNPFLETITLSDNCYMAASTDHGSTIFYCPNLKSIDVGENNRDLKSVDGVLFSKSYSGDALRTLITYPSGKEDKDYLIPDGVEEIANFAFSYNKNLVSVSFPDSISSLSSIAFQYCPSLTSVTLSANIQTVTGWAFSSCDNLKEIKLNPGNEYLAVENGALYNKDMTELMVYFPGNPNSAFMIPEGVTTIGEAAFIDRKNLTFVSIPDSVTTLERYAFFGCSSLSDIEMGSGVEEIPESCFSSTGFTDFAVPGHVKTIGSQAFYYCQELANVIISEGVTAIDSRAFRYCTDLKSVIIPESVTEIDRLAFQDCPDDMVIYGIANSYAEEYCKQWRIHFEPLALLPADEETGIVVYGSENALEKGTQLKVETVESEEGMVIYDISLVDENGRQVQPNEGKSVTVRIPLPDGMSGVRCRIYRTETDENGNVTYTNMNARSIRIDGVLYLEFTTEHFSEYVITEKELGTKPGDEDPEPGTGSGSEDPEPGTGSGDEDPEPGTGSGSEDPEPGTGSGSEDPEPGTGSGGEDPEPGTGSGSEDPEPGTGSGSEDPEPGTGSGSEDPEPGTGSGSEDPEPGTGSGDEDPEPVVTTRRTGLFTVPVTVTSESTTQPPAAAETTTAAETETETTTATTTTTATAAVTDNAAPAATTSAVSSTVSAPASETDSANNVGNAGGGAQADKNVNTGFVLAFIPAAAAAVGVIIAKKRK